MAQIILNIDDALVSRIRSAFRNVLGNQAAGMPEIKTYLRDEIKRVVKLDEADSAARAARLAAETSVDGINIT